VLDHRKRREKGHLSLCVKTSFGGYRGKSEGGRVVEGELKVNFCNNVASDRICNAT